MAAINEHLMKLCFPLNITHHLTIISAYAPTLTSPDEAKEQFYEDLGHLIKATPPSDKFIILGEFNARVGKVSDDWKGVLGPHSVGNLNSNSLLLLSKCAKQMLCITNTTFHQTDKYKATWMHQRSKQWPLIDFVIFKLRDIQDIRITCSMHGAECWSDHRLVRSILRLHIAPTQHKHSKVIRSSLNTARLRHPYNCNMFWETLDEKLKASAPYTEDSSEKWCQFKKIVTETAKAVLGPKKCKHQDWFDENDECITQLLHEKTQAYVKWQMTQAPNPRQTNSNISENKPRRDCMRWKTIGGTERQLKCKNTQAQTTPNSSSELWRLYMGPHDLDPPLYYQLMDQHWSRARRLLREWWLETFLTTYWKDLHQSAPLHLTRIPQQPTLDAAWSSTVSHWIHENHPPDELQSSTRKRWNSSQVVQSCRPRSKGCLPWYPQLHLGTREDARRFPRCLDCSPLQK